MSAKVNKKLPKIIILAAIAVLVVGSLVYKIFNFDSATSEKANLSELYSAEEGSAAIVVNGKITGVRAAIKDQQIYIRLGILTDEINAHFYYEPNEKILFYTDAERTIEAEESDLYEGYKIFYDSEEDLDETTKTTDERIYVLLSYITKYTNIEADYFKNPSRVFLRSKFGECQEAKSDSGAVMRTEAKDSAPVITELSSGSELWIISSDDDWALAYEGEDYGHAGYISVEDIKDVETVNVDNAYTEPEYKSNQLSEPLCLAWHQVFNSSGVDNLSSYLSTAKYANVVCPTWFSVDSSSGDIESRANKSYVRKAKEKGLQVWALVENFNTDNTLDYSALLGTKESRKNMIDELIEKAVEYDIDGINVDFEGLPASAGAGYSQFIRELAIECRKNDLVISVDCYVPSAWTEHYNRKEIAKVVDYLIVMAYDEHYEGSEAGSTSSIDFVDEAISDTLALGVSKDKLVCAVPFYSRLWKGEGTAVSSEVVSMDEMKEFMSAHSAETSWDDNTSQYYVEVKIDDVTNRLWVEDGKSLDAKLDTIKNYGLAGIAGWKLGKDNSEAWTAIASYLGK